MRPRRAVAEINVVPYIDVMLVLLVIFMATAPLLMQGVDVDLPKANSTPVSDSDAEPLIVSIDAQAKLYLNLGASDDQALSIETVRQRVATVLKRNPDKAVMVWGDADVPYGEVVALMSELQSAGAPSVGLVTEAPARK